MFLWKLKDVQSRISSYDRQYLRCFQSLSAYKLFNIQQNLGNCNTKIRMKHSRYIISRKANKALENQEASMAEKLKANLGKHSSNKKR